MTENKKVRNATAMVVNGIKFRSKLEGYLYSLLRQYKIEAEYEQHRFVLFPGFTWKGKKYLQITYTPDFVSLAGKFIIEAKGYANDIYPLKKKMFFKYLIDNNMEDFVFYEVKSQKECRELLPTLLRLHNPIS